MTGLNCDWFLVLPRITLLLPTVGRGRQLDASIILKSGHCCLLDKLALLAQRGARNWLRTPVKKRLMCGIAGIIDHYTAPSDSLLRRMGEPLARRGPDSEGMLVRGDCGLIHRRLAVIDPAGGQQPLLNENESLALICNGEIYDYAVWRDELKARGHRFRTGSDNEVILHLYEEKGADCVSLLNGMFAFAIFDLRTGEVFIARDQFGQKPLFYATAPGRIAVASGTRSLLKLPWVEPGLDFEAVHDYLEFQYVPAPKSIYRSIQKLLPQQYAFWNGSELKSYTYSPKTGAELYARRFADSARLLRERFSVAVQRRMVADVPVGLFLSGGIDSGLVCAAAQRLTSEPVQTFSIGFPVREYDESPEAVRVAEYLGTEHHVLEVNPADFTHLRELVGEFEEPFCDASMLPMSLVSRFARESVTVALSGDGADELFGGYDRYRVMQWLQWWSKIPNWVRRKVRTVMEKLVPSSPCERTRLGKLRRTIALLDKEGASAYRALLSRFSAAQRRTLYGPAMSDVDGSRTPGQDYRQWGGGDWAVAAMQSDMALYLPNDILVKVDRASMAHGLEVRSPFLDPELAAWARALPQKWKLHHGYGKYILRQAFRGYLPAATFKRGKMGFGVPIAHWLRDDWQNFLRELLPQGKAVQMGLFESRGVESMINRHCVEGQDESYPLFAILVLELWLRQT